MITRRTLLRRAAALPCCAVFLPLTASAEQPPALPPGQPLRVVWVWPDGERLDAAQARAARADIAHALAYWNSKAPYPGLYVVREEASRVADPYASWVWLKQLYQPGLITAAIVVNHGSRRLVDLGGGVAAPAYHWPGKATFYASLVSAEPYRWLSVGGQVAHELGHALYNLPDGEGTDPIMVDVMDTWEPWVASREGC